MNGFCCVEEFFHPHDNEAKGTYFDSWEYLFWQDTSHLLSFAETGCFVAAVPINLTRKIAQLLWLNIKLELLLFCDSCSGCYNKHRWIHHELKIVLFTFELATVVTTEW